MFLLYLLNYNLCPIKKKCNTCYYEKHLAKPIKKIIKKLYTLAAKFPVFAGFQGSNYEVIIGYYILDSCIPLGDGRVTRKRKLLGQYFSDFNFSEVVCRALHCSRSKQIKKRELRKFCLSNLLSNDEWFYFTIDRYTFCYVRRSF